MKQVKKTTKDRRLTFATALSWLYIGAGLLGLLASFVLTVDKIELLKDPSFQPACNVSPLISCGSAMSTPQSEVFGFPNSMLGMIGFTAVAVTGFALLAGAQFKKWYWLGLNFGSLLATIFVGWFVYQSIYELGTLCPYCMTSWVATLPIFWYTTLYNLRRGYIPTPNRLKKIVAFIQSHHADILFVVFLTIIGLILEHFWYYWETLV